MDGTPSERRLGQGGLSRTLCSKHVNFRARHGHPAKPSWTGPEFRPYVRVAERYIRRVLLGKHKPSLPGLAPDYAVRATVQAYSAMVSAAGPSLRDLPASPRAHAKAVLGRLRANFLAPPEDEAAGPRKAKVIDAEEIGIRIAARVVGLELTRHFDPAPADLHFLRVQIGKAVHRIAGGHHRTFEWGANYVLEMNRYGRSTGRHLEVLGGMLQERDLISDRHRGELIEWAKAAAPMSPIADWTACKRESKRGGRKRKPYKSAEQRGHDRIKPTPTRVLGPSGADIAKRLKREAKRRRAPDLPD